VSVKAVTDPLFFVVNWRLNSHWDSASGASQVLFRTLVSTQRNGLEQSENILFYDVSSNCNG